MNLNLTDAEVERILNFLADHPYKEVFQLMNKIISQVNESRAKMANPVMERPNGESTRDTHPVSS